MDAIERREYIKIAKELRYPDEVIAKLQKAETTYECDKIMQYARLADT